MNNYNQNLASDKCPERRLTPEAGGQLIKAATGTRGALEQIWGQCPQ